MWKWIFTVLAVFFGVMGINEHGRASEVSDNLATIIASPPVAKSIYQIRDLSEQDGPFRDFAISDFDVAWEGFFGSRSFLVVGTRSNPPIYVAFTQTGATSRFRNVLSQMERGETVVIRGVLKSSSLYSGRIAQTVQEEGGSIESDQIMMADWLREDRDAAVRDYLQNEQESNNYGFATAIVFALLAAWNFYQDRPARRRPPQS